MQNGPPYPLGAEKGTYHINKDGSIVISKGAVMQRLVDENSEAATKKKIYPGMNYASFTANDNAKYIVNSNGRLFEGVNRNALITLRAENELHSPSTGEASRIFYQMLKDNPKFAEKAGILLRDKPYTEKEIEGLIRYSQRTNNIHGDYLRVNHSLTYYDNGDWDEIKKSYFQYLKKSGYNMLRDNNDTNSGAARNPVIVLDSASNLSVQSVTIIDDSMRKNAAQYVKKYSGEGRKYLRMLGFPIPDPIE